MTSKQEAIISGEQIKNMLLGAYRSFEKIINISMI